MAEDVESPETESPSTESPSTDELGSAASLLNAIADAPGAPDRAPLGTGQLVAGKYRVVGRIGEGGMGVVYLARDVRLERDTALKLGTAVSSAALARLEQEARALARLSHPNVVVIFEVGVVGDQVFVAMEHVAGGTARAWLAARQRNWREIVALYCAAGDGLAAAHAAGIVHRDFKPDNVLVGEDDRPRVADFGLARELREVSAPTEQDASAPSRTGAVVGTLAYMPPEQLAGDVVDARADQFAFCAALWEALYGIRPFPGATTTEVRIAIESSAPRTATGRVVPRNVELALRRGLSAAASDRWPALSPVLAELRRDPGRRRRRIAIGVAFAVALAGAALVPLALRDSGPTPCSDDAIAAVWNDARGSAVAQAWSSIGGSAAWQSLRPRVDHYARAWTTAHHDACTATRIDGSQSEAILDRRMLCLGGARAQLDAIVESFLAGGRAALEHAPDALALLPDLAACADVAMLDREAPLPADRAARAAIERTTKDLAVARVATIRGDAPDPAGLGDRLLAAATATGWGPLIAHAARIRASLLLDAGRVDAGRDAMQQAAVQAIGAGDDRDAAWAMVDLAWDLAGAHHPKDARPWLDLSRAIWSRSGEDPDLGVRLLGTEATCDWTLGKAADGLAITRRQGELARRAYGDDPFSVAASHFNLGIALQLTGAYDEAARETEIALHAMEAVVGNDHRITAYYSSKLAELELQLGKLDPALAHIQRALAYDQKWRGGADTSQLATDHDLLGNIERARGEIPAARAAFEHELALLRDRTTDPGQLANLETNLGILEASTNHFAEAIPYAEKALVDHRAILGAENPQLSNDYILLGFAHRGLGKLADAEREERIAVRLVEAAVGPNHPDAVNPRTELSYTLVLAGRAGDAAALLAPMVALAESKAGVAPPAAAEVHMAYADALWKSGGDRARARAAVVTARDAYAALGEGFEPQRTQADTWLREHR